MDQQAVNQKDDLQDQVIDYTQYPDAKGHFGIHGGRFVSETLMAALEDLEKLEQLRALENGFSIGAVLTSQKLMGVDVPEDIIKVEGALK